MNSTDLHGWFRSEVGDIEEPYLWSDEDVFRYMDAAQDQLCRAPLLGIADASSPVTVIPITAGEVFSPVSECITQIRGATLVSTGRELEVFNYFDLANKQMEKDYGFSVRPIMSSTLGPIRSVVLGVEDDKLRWNAIPEVDDEVHLTVFRRPTTAITDFDQELELRSSDYREGFLHWMKYLAYGKQDADAFDRGKQAEFREAYEEFAVRMAAAQRRKLHKPRVVLYGGL